MFSVLQIKPQGGGIKNWFTGKRSETVESERIIIPGVSAFNVITAYSRKGRVDFENVVKAAGRTAGYIVAGENAFLPADDERLAFYYGEKLYENMLYNTALELITRSGRKPNTVSALLVDKNAVFVSEIGRLVEKAASVTVITDKNGIYENAAKKIFAEYGASIIVRSGLISVKNVDIIISPGLCEDKTIRGTITVNNIKKHISPVFRAGDFDFPLEYAKYKPSGVEKRDFASALYEFGSADELGKKSFRSLTVNSNEISLLSASKTLDTGDGI